MNITLSRECIVLLQELRKFSIPQINHGHSLVQDTIKMVEEIKRSQIMTYVYILFGVLSSIGSDQHSSHYRAKKMARVP